MKERDLRKAEGDRTASGEQRSQSAHALSVFSFILLAADLGAVLWYLLSFRGYTVAQALFGRDELPTADKFVLSAMWLIGYGLYILGELPYHGWSLRKAVASRLTVVSTVILVAAALAILVRI